MRVNIRDDPRSPVSMTDPARSADRGDFSRGARKNSSCEKKTITQLLILEISSREYEGRTKRNDTRAGKNIGSCHLLAGLPRPRDRF